MRYISFRVVNYKSYVDSGDLILEPGFNSVVGPNDAGKTALLEALSLQVGTIPHRSPRTAPESYSQVSGPSSFRFTFEIPRDEFLALAYSTALKTFVIAVSGNSDTMTQVAAFQNAIATSVRVNCVWQDGAFHAPAVEGYGEPPGNLQAVRMTVVSPRGPIKASGAAQTLTLGTDINFQLAQRFKEAIYFARAERYNLGRVAISGGVALTNNASNLADVLHSMQSANPARFDLFCKLVCAVLPEVRGITVPARGNECEVMIWPLDPSTDREDLAIPLSRSGTGVSQVLALLAIVVTSKLPRVLLIEEPQTFLHPGALRNLFEVLQQHPHHQYVITSHSPLALSSLGDGSVLLVEKREMESGVRRLDPHTRDHVRAVLASVGARLSDTFGADKILWVEGATEEECFPLIVRDLLKRPLFGIAVLGVISTGDFEGKRARLTMQIYRKLSEGEGLLPPALGFLFDKERRSPEERADLEVLGARFLTRRMFENYLLDPGGIAAVANGIHGFHAAPITQEEVAIWIEQNRWSREFFAKDIPESQRSAKYWQENVDGAAVLDRLFTSLSETRVPYSKVEHGKALTEWLLVHRPDELREVAKLLASLIPESRLPD
jgi:energy-coupling factor transporter ATP-binding protein EcfA2